MEVYLFRHGEVENPRKVLYGRLPGFHLSSLGRKHVRETAQKLKDKNVKKIYSSPLERALETSEILLEELNLNRTDLIVEDRLIESDVSKWQGTDLEEYKKKVVFGMSPRTQKEIEPITDAGKRILNFLNDNVKQSGWNAIIVSHGDPLVGLLIELSGDWSIVENRIMDRYIKRAEFVKLVSEESSWKIEEYSY